MSTVEISQEKMNALYYKFLESEGVEKFDPETHLALNAASKAWFMCGYKYSVSHMRDHKLTRPFPDICKRWIDLLENECAIDTPETKKVTKVKAKPKSVFIRGAWLCSLDEELTEQEFIVKSGGLDKLMEFRGYPYVSLNLDDPKDPDIIGHFEGSTVAVVMQMHGCDKFQTMEWRK